MLNVRGVLYKDKRADAINANNVMSTTDVRTRWRCDEGEREFI